MIVEIPTPIDDAHLRDEVISVARAIAHGDHEPPLDTRIVAIPRSSCEPLNTRLVSAAFDARNRDAARLRIASIVAAVGVPVSLTDQLRTTIDREPTLDDVTRSRTYIDGAPPFGIRCASDEHRIGSIDEQNPEFPTQATLGVGQRYQFSQHVRFHVPVSRASGQVPDVWGAPVPNLAVRLQASEPLLVLEGTAPMHLRPNGIRYSYIGTSTLEPDDLRRVRERLRAAGVSADDIIAEYDWALRPHVIVYGRTTTVNAEIATAIVGAGSADRAAVLVAPTYGACVDEAKAIAGAVADAAGRAKRIAALIGSTANPAPVTVGIEYGTIDRPCDPRAVIGDEISVTQAEGAAALPEPSRDIVEVVHVGVFAAFPITTPRALVGSVKEAAARDHSWIASFGYVPPPTQYPAASTHGDAQLEMTLHRHSVKADGPSIASDPCVRAADTLARDTIRAAVEHVTAAPGSRLIAIDLRGPFAVEGTCQNVSTQSSVEPLNDPSMVRIAAYARASFGR